MERLVPILIMVALLAASQWFTGGRLRRPRPAWMALSATAAAAALILAGTIGYSLGSAAWSDTVIWWEVGCGLALMPLAAYFWQKSFRFLGSSSQAELSN